MSAFLSLVTDSPHQPSAIWPDCTYYFLLVIMSDNKDLTFVLTQHVRLLTACSNVRTENMMGLPYWSRISLHFKAPEVPLSSSQQLAEEPYIDPNVSSPQPHAVFRRIHWNTTFPHTPRSAKWFPAFGMSRTKFCINLPYLPSMLHVQPISCI